MQQDSAEQQQQQSQTARRQQGDEKSRRQHGKAQKQQQQAADGRWERISSRSSKQQREQEQLPQLRTSQPRPHPFYVKPRHVKKHFKVTTVDGWKLHLIRLGPMSSDSCVWWPCHALLLMLLYIDVKQQGPYCLVSCLANMLPCLLL